MVKRTKPEVCASQHLKALCLTFTLMYLLRISAFIFLVKLKFFHHALVSHMSLASVKFANWELQRNLDCSQFPQWIALNFHNKSLIEIHLAYIITFNKTNKHSISCPSQFQCIINHFKSAGGVTGQSILCGHQKIWPFPHFFVSKPNGLSYRSGIALIL